MRITVRLFGQLRDVAGTPLMEQEVPDHATVDAAWYELIRAVPALGPHRQAVAVAVDDEFARFTSALRPGCTVAFLPPVSGG
jgi:molybdopterin converting factor subunit 1